MCSTQTITHVNSAFVVKGDTRLDARSMQGRIPNKVLSGTECINAKVNLFESTYLISCSTVRHVHWE